MHNPYVFVLLHLHPRSALIHVGRGSCRGRAESAALCLFALSLSSFCKEQEPCWRRHMSAEGTSFSFLLFLPFHLTPPPTPSPPTSPQSAISFLHLTPIPLKTRLRFCCFITPKRLKMKQESPQSTDGREIFPEIAEPPHTSALQDTNVLFDSCFHCTKASSSKRWRSPQRSCSTIL